MPGSRWFRFASPRTFDRVGAQLAPWFRAAALAATAAGLAVGLVVAPPDALQGDLYRIMYVHVPAAWMSMFLYLLVAGYSALDLAFHTRLSALMAQALAPSGALFTAIALASGALWGKPAWGAWWVWDARLTSELVLLFLYLGFILLHAAIGPSRRADRASSLLALAGVVNLPVIFFSVQWWHTLHQGPSLGFGSGVAMTASMLCGVLLVTLGFWAHAVAVALARARALIRERARAAPWEAGELR